MPWLRIDDRVRTHPKIVAAGPDASWFWFCGICYCREHLTDGFIPQGILASLCPGVGISAARRLATRLVTTNLWHRADGGFQVHDFLDWNPARETVVLKRKEERERKDRERKSVRADNTALSDMDNSNLSARTDGSVRSDSGGGVREVSSRARAIARGSGLGSGTGSEESARETRPRSLTRSMKPWNAWEGERLEVPQKWHEDHVRMLGGEDADARLQAWYSTLDLQLVRSQTPVQNWFRYLDACYAGWVTPPVMPSSSDVPDVEETRRRLRGAK